MVERSRKVGRETDMLAKQTSGVRRSRTLSLAHAVPTTHLLILTALQELR